ncbi:MAG TPA: GNAT family N-acetyltransferase [Candidatus Sulfopaludibacter sp.]|nr:GNAT family N-acetyltransferase [Candidatus Sulfopaludibacter sp.]
MPLSADTLPAALDFRRELYLHEDLVYEPGDAARLVRELIESPEYGGIWLILVDGQAAGYLLLTVCYSLEFGGRFGLLDEFYLDDRWRGQGIGTAALAFCEDACRERGLRALRLEVGHSNPRALELYRRSGFAVESRHLMTKWI